MSTARRAGAPLAYNARSRSTRRFPVKATLRALVAQAIDALRAAGTLPADFATPDFVIERPKNADQGDFATNAAMLLAKAARSNPRENSGCVTVSTEVHDPKTSAGSSTGSPRSTWRASSAVTSRPSDSRMTRAPPVVTEPSPVEPATAAAPAAPGRPGLRPAVSAAAPRASAAPTAGSPPAWAWRVTWTRKIVLAT